VQGVKNLVNLRLFHCHNIKKTLRNVKKLDKNKKT